MSKKIIALTFSGNGAFRADMPARDLDAGDIERLGPEQVELAASSGLYTPVFEEEEEAEESQAADETVDPDKLKKDELVALAEERELDTSGTKAEIAERIAAFEESQAADQAATEVSNG